ncbi:Uncharacterized protein GBIM_15660 [Gryllus bimaculatus]|nr:Uncharacterized protein GBIM_15660 [Gryllus bimaculatus]
MAVTVRPLKGERAEKFLSLHQRGNEPQGLFGPTGCVLPLRFTDSAQQIKEFEVREDDVWIITPPQSGTTWTQEMVWLLVNDLNYDKSKETSLFKRCPFLEFSRFLPEAIVKNLEMDTLEFAANDTSPRCIKSHLHKQLLPEQLWTKKPKIVFVAREPKDVAVSSFHQYELVRGYKGDREFYFQCFYEDMVQFTPLWEHVLEFWKMKDDPKILFNTYEEMKQDLPAVIRRTAKFLGKILSEEQVTRLAEHLDIKRMKENPSTNCVDLLRKARISDEQPFIRKGVVGEGRRLMSPEMAARFDARTRRVFQETGDI